MMKKKLTFLMFGLLIAVGWNMTASAQALPIGKTVKFDLTSSSRPVVQQNVEHPKEGLLKDQGNGSMLRAPHRSNHYDEVASAVHPKSWYEQWYYTYNDGTQDQNAYFTEPATNPYQMMALTYLIYTQPVFPGIKYSKPSGKDLEYPRIQFGWGISGDHYNDIIIKTTASNLNIESIKITDQNGSTVVNWSADDNYYYYNNTWVNLPSGWTASHNNNSSGVGTTRLRRGTSGVFITHVYGYLEGGGEITIPLVNLTGGVHEIEVTYSGDDWYSNATETGKAAVAPVEIETKYTDLTADSIYGKLSGFSSEEVQVGDTLTFTVKLVVPVWETFFCVGVVSVTV